MFLIFPGLLFSSVMGLLAGWVDRYLTARLQWRVGPPWYQNFLDVIKLIFYKETLVPEGASKLIFFGMPVLAASAAALVSTIILAINGAPSRSFLGDLIVIAYLLMIPPIAVMLGGFASRNPLASLGSSREMKLMLSYELPFILALIVPIIKSGYTVKLGGIITAQGAEGFFVGTVSGALALFAMLFCVHAKLGLVPFDMPEAETELMGGAYIEYSGKALGIYKIGKAILLFAVPVLMISLFFGGIRLTTEGFVKNLLQYFLILGLMVVIRNTNPRVRIDQAVNFFWGTMTSVAVLSVTLALAGRIWGIKWL